MAAKIIRKEGKKLIIEITIDLEDSMLDSEEAIQAVVNEAGTLATEEAFKQFDTQGVKWTPRSRQIFIEFKIESCTHYSWMALSQFFLYGVWYSPSSQPIYSKNKSFSFSF
jgi:hypothetical protein